MLHSHLLSFRVAVEVVRPDVFAEHHVIVEINELLGEPGDAVDVGLNGRGAESGEVAVILEDILEVKGKNTFKAKHIIKHSFCVSVSKRLQEVSLLI